MSPRNIRNFWLTLEVDGKQRTVATGPRAKDGGFMLSIKMRDNGGIVRVMTVDGRASDSGLLVLSAGLTREAASLDMRNVDSGGPAADIVVKTRR